MLDQELQLQTFYYSTTSFNIFYYHMTYLYLRTAHWTELCSICSFFRRRICQILWNKLKYNKLKRNSTFYHWHYFVFFILLGAFTYLSYVQRFVLRGSPHLRALSCSGTSEKPPWLRFLQYRELVTGKKHSPVAGPFPRVIKSLKVLIMANTPITVWPHIGCPSFSSPLKHYFAIKPQS